MQLEATRVLAYTPIRGHLARAVRVWPAAADLRNEVR